MPTTTTVKRVAFGTGLAVGLALGISGGGYLATEIAPPPAVVSDLQSASPTASAPRHPTHHTTTNWSTMTDTPTDLDAGNSGRITFLRSTTTTRVDTEADGDIKTTVSHVARFAAPEGVVPDQTHRYGSQTFAPRFITAMWTDARLTEVRITGPRRLKSGEVADSGERNHDANSREQEYRGAMLDPDVDMSPERHRSSWDVPLPSVVATRLADYELAVATLTGGPR